jgi:hypothetical protein
MIRLRADFNGLFDNGRVLCLSHSDTCTDEDGAEVHLRAGMTVTAFDHDADEYGNPDKLVATGVVEESRGWLSCTGSRWILRVDENGVRHESEIKPSEGSPRRGRLP